MTEASPSFRNESLERALRKLVNDWRAETQVVSRSWTPLSTLETMASELEDVINDPVLGLAKHELKNVTDIEITKRIDDIVSEMKRLQEQIHTLASERERLEHERSRRKYTCPCVRLNRDLNINDMGDLERAGRNGLSASGWVRDNFSAYKCCTTCGGRGIPKKATT